MLQTIDGQARVRLIDLSGSGAKVLLDHRPSAGDAVLQWLGFESFGTMLWKADGLIGIHFDEPLDPSVLTRTRLLAPDLAVSEGKLTDAAARDWVRGSFNSGTER